MSFIGSKRALSDVYPVRQKKFFVLTDPESLQAQGGMTTIATLVEKKAKVVVALSFGGKLLSGVPITLSEKQREVIVNAFQEEKGLGLTSYFFNLTPKVQFEILKRAKLSKDLPKTCNDSRGSGKTPFFASLPLEERVSILRNEFPQLASSLSSNGASYSTKQFVAQITAGLPAGTVVHFVQDPLQLKATVKAGEVAVLENLQLYRNETSTKYEDRQAMAQVLASYADVYVNDAFASASATRASNVNLPKIMRHGAAGFLMERELLYFNRVLTHPARPTGIVVGGSKVAEKLVLVKSMLGKVDIMLLAGAVALPFLAAQGVGVGKGFDQHLVVESDGKKLGATDLAKAILAEAVAKKVRIVLPVDHIVSPTIDGASKKSLQTSGIGGVPSDLYAVDIGPNTGVVFAKAVKECNTVFWTGTLGYADIDGFHLGTDAFAKTLVNSGALTVVGGSHTLEAVQKSGVAGNVSHMTSGGLTSMCILQGDELPALEALSDVGVAVDALSPQGAGDASSAAASISELLRHLPLFAGCSSHQLNAVARKTTRRSHAVGDFVVYEGDRMTCMWVVAAGGFAVYASGGAKEALRAIDKGHSAGQYEFITHAVSAETVRVSKPDTVSYQLTHAALNDVMNEVPDLAAQLVANMSLPLRLLGERNHHHLQQHHSGGASSSAAGACPFAAVITDAEVSRTPAFFKTGSTTTPGSELLTGVVSAVALKTFTQEIYTFKEEAGTCVIALPLEGVAMRALMNVVRTFVYHKAVAAHGGSVGVVAGTVLSALVATPLRMASTGTPLNVRAISLDTLVDQSLISGAAAFAPLAAHSLYTLFTAGKRTKADGTDAFEVAMAVLARLVTGCIFYPIIARRQPASMANPRAFLFYLAKQVAALLLEFFLTRMSAQKKASAPKLPSSPVKAK